MEAKIAAIKKAKAEAEAHKEDDEIDFLSIDIPVTNILEHIERTKINYSASYQDSMKAKPRPLPKHLGDRDKVKTAWDFKASVFRDYKPDTDPIRR